jgi:uncharacterized protein
VPQPLRRLLAIVLEQYGLPVDGVHGIGHWGRVLETGRRLCPVTGADPVVVEVFALLHDAKRRNEGHDPGHGPRAAAFARRIRAEIPLTDTQVALLLVACEVHTRGAAPGADATVLTCLDADRLDIPRVGKPLRVEYLSRAAAGQVEIVTWAVGRAVGRHVPDVVATEWGWPGG